MRNNAALECLRVGDYVFVSRWSDCDWNDPWGVGFIKNINENNVVICNEDGSFIEGVCSRSWPYAKRVTKEQGQKILDIYPPLEGLPYDEEGKQWEPTTCHPNEDQ